MNCEQIQPSLLEYSLRPSSCPDREVIREHLDRCELCRAVLDQEYDISARLDTLASVAPVTDMWSVVREKTRGRTPIHSRVGAWFKPLNARRLVAAGATVCMLAAALVVGVSDYTGKRQEAAVSYLVEMHMPSQTVMAWTDDPLGVTDDYVLQALEEGS